MMLQEKNPADFRLVMEKYRKDLADKNQEAGPVTLGGRLLSSRFPQGYEAISYGRATWLFHMLRSMLQDTAEDGEKKETSQPRSRGAFRALFAQNPGTLRRKIYHHS